VDWCSQDSGPTMLTDRHGYRHAQYVSVTRDGAVWVRVGHVTGLDLTVVAESGRNRGRVQATLLDDDAISTLMVRLSIFFQMRSGQKMPQLGALKFNYFNYLVTFSLISAKSMSRQKHIRRVGMR